MTSAIDADDAARFPCTGCGAMLAWDPASSHLLCSHCGTSNAAPVPKAAPDESDLLRQLDALADEVQTHEQVVIDCPACGASVQPDPNITAANCPYCGTHLNVTLKIARAILPSALLAFAVPKTRSEESFFAWARSRWFAPNALKRLTRMESRMAGVYVPHWTYDADTRSDYTGQRGDDYSETVGSGKNRRTVRRTRWRRVGGHVARRFDDLLIVASRSLPEKYLRSLMPWDLEHLVGYEDHYVAGYRCECYQIDLRAGWGAARLQMEEQIRGDVRADIGGDHQRIDDVDTHWSQLRFRHILLPVWISSYVYKGKTYRFLVNARSGEVQGDRPWSWVKITLAALAGAAVVAVVVLLASR